jgi:hypothetical protein
LGFLGLAVVAAEWHTDAMTKMLKAAGNGVERPTRLVRAFQNFLDYNCQPHHPRDIVLSLLFLNPIPLRRVITHGIIMLVRSVRNRSKDGANPNRDTTRNRTRDDKKEAPQT